MFAVYHGGGGKRRLKQSRLHEHPWRMGAWVEFNLYIVNNKPFSHQARLAKSLNVKAAHFCILNGTIMVFPKHPFSRTFSNPAANNASQDECAWCFACQNSRRFTVFHCKKKGCSRQFHSIFTLFPCRCPIAKPMINVSRTPKKSKTLSIEQLEHVYMVFSRLWKAYVSATSTTKPFGY